MNYMLEPDKTSSYYLPFASPEKVYVRTGVHADGSCFFHAYLRVTKVQYKHASYEERRAHVSRLREKLSTAVTNESLSELSNNELRKMLFFEQLRARASCGFPRDSQYGALLNEFISIEKVLEASTTFEGNFYTHFVENIVEAGRARIGQKFEKFIPYIKSWCVGAFSEANQDVVDGFKRRLLKDQISTTEVEFVARQVECNFLFLREREIYPYSANINPLWPYVILLWLSDNHYEIIGEMNVDKSVKRKFWSKDSIIDLLTKNDSATATQG